MSGADLHNAVLVYYADPDRLTDAELTARYLEWLTPEETARYRRFVPDHARREFLMGRALLRATLGHLLGQPPRALGFGATRHGKLFLTQPRETGIEFNLTHTRRLAALAVTREAPVGIDAETIDATRAIREIAERYFAKEEMAELAQRSGDDFVRRFFELWTLKEAWIKAKGLGLSLPLRDFCIRFPRGEHAPIAIEFAPKLNEKPEAWQLELMQPRAETFMAVAVRRPPRLRLAIQSREFTPGIDALT